jgi:peptidoglycan/LPS O-acetylase OafA/YrhL
MLLTWSTAAMGLISFGLQIIAHLLMWQDGEPERAPTPRYAVGLCIIGVCLSAALVFDDRQHPITAFWYIAALSGAATGLCYYLRGRGEVAPLPKMTPQDLEYMADLIAGEHDDAPESRDQY